MSDRPRGGQAADDRTADTVAGAVRWPAAGTLDRIAFARLDESSRDAVRTSPVPVLVLREPALLAVTRVMTGPAWYAIAAREGGLTISLGGTRLAHPHPGVAPARGRSIVRGEPAFVTQNEAIWSASWLENGVAYVLEVECDTPSEPRCADERTLLGLTAALSYVGGAGGQP